MKPNLFTIITITAIILFIGFIGAVGGPLVDDKLNDCKYESVAGYFPARILWCELFRKRW